MLNTLQIVLLSVIGAMAIASILFLVMFILEISLTKKVIVKKQKSKKSKVEAQISVDEMIKNIEKQANEAEVENVLQDDKEENTSSQNNIEIHNINIINDQSTSEENNNSVEINSDLINEVMDSISENEEIENNEEVVVLDENSDEDIDAENSDENGNKEDDEYEYQVVTFDKSANGEIDYVSRLQKIQASKVKLEKDLNKVDKFIINYERTERRKNRNQKMLDKRASELTNLNLVMYSVTDIKNVDEDKKVKQQELTSHIAELKASIQDAEEYLDSNKEKYNHSIKMSKFLTQENVRITDEIVEIKKLIASNDNK